VRYENTSTKANVARRNGSVAIEILKQVFNVPLQMTIASVATLVFVTVLLPIGVGATVRSFAPA